MKTVLVRDFIRSFSRLRAESVRVRQRNRVLGTWIPESTAPEPVDVMERLKQDFAEPLPFTGTQLLKAGKKR
jgi:hypothetical protein